MGYIIGKRAVKMPNIPTESWEIYHIIEGKYKIHGKNWGHDDDGYYIVCYRKRYFIMIFHSASMICVGHTKYPYINEASISLGDPECFDKIDRFFLENDQKIRHTRIKNIILNITFVVGLLAVIFGSWIVSACAISLVYWMMRS